MDRWEIKRLLNAQERVVILSEMDWAYEFDKKTRFR